ncbi:type III secretion HpaP family protein [Spartinivicinus poritis]|uniref:Flagellar hook-length control protein FliK n=1 Tax=Spartinivicinus poritis TaxID=2994640 RepID=A0ABT5U3P2_9GAMM|nr:type III secretion HpaP family protein [Spartinivicinus sp. A2-2]MDE1460986.1 flagellar hook-length control protein FliK [Spartinivicinus sp. A2-2]
MKIDSSKSNRSTTSAENARQRSSQVDKEHFEKQLNKQPKQSSRKDDLEKQPDTLSSLPNPFMLAASIKQAGPSHSSQVIAEVSQQLTELITEYRRQLSNQSTLQITLNHPLLNNTQLTLSLTNNQLQIAFATSEKQQYDLLNQASTQLKNQLAKRFGQVSVELGLSTDTTHQQGARPDDIAKREEHE